MHSPVQLLGCQVVESAPLMDDHFLRRELPGLSRRLGSIWKRDQALRDELERTEKIDF